MISATRDRVEFEHVITQTLRLLQHVGDQLLDLRVPPDEIREPMSGPVLQDDDPLQDSTNDPLREILHTLAKHEDDVRAGLHELNTPDPVSNESLAVAATASVHPAPAADTAHAEQPPTDPSASGSRLAAASRKGKSSASTGSCWQSVIRAMPTTAPETS